MVWEDENVEDADDVDDDDVVDDDENNASFPYSLSPALCCDESPMVVVSSPPSGFHDGELPTDDISWLCQVWTGSGARPSRNQVWHSINTFTPNNSK